jgi:hypothetical protein
MIADLLQKTKKNVKTLSLLIVQKQNLGILFQN